MKLNITSNHKGRAPGDVHGLYHWLFCELELEHNYDLVSELSNDQVWAASKNFNPFNNNQRLIADRSQSGILAEFCNDFHSFKDQLINWAASDNQKLFSSRWYMDPAHYKNVCDFNIEVYKDTAGFSMPPHLDNSHIMIQAIINLTENPTGTEIYTFDSREPFYQAPTQKNKGLAFLNNSGAVHGIRNVTQDRYILYASIILK